MIGYEFISSIFLESEGLATFAGVPSIALESTLNPETRAWRVLMIHLQYYLYILHIFICLSVIDEMLLDCTCALLDVRPKLVVIRAARC